MSRPLVPRTSQGSPNLEVPQTPSQRPKKISTACGACKQRKTRCSGGTPCEACATRNSPCIYDVTSDQRRKIANQRNVQDLVEAQHELERHRQLLGGIIATIRAGDEESNNDLVSLIRSEIDLSQLAAHVRNECRSNLEIQQAYDAINFTIDSHDELPSPMRILSSTRGAGGETASALQEQRSGSGSGSGSGSRSVSHSGDIRMFSPDPT